MTQPAPEGMSTQKLIFCAAIELSLAKWKVAFSNGDRERLVTISAGDWESFEKEVAKARLRLGVAELTRLATCYEAGRDGFWIHRRLVELGIDNVVVDPSSILVSRRARRRKTDSLDAFGLVEQLVRHLRGDKNVWGVVRVPTLEEEDARRVHREHERLVKERTGHITRVKSLLALHGLKAGEVRKLGGMLEKLPVAIRAEVVRELERLKLVDDQLKQVAASRAQAVNDETTPQAEKMRRLQELKAVGPVTSLVLVTELFGWRNFKNGKEVGSFAGLTPTPHDSGGLEKEQGISKAGNRRVRTLCVEIAWVWLRHQPESALSKWFNARFSKGGRSRRLGIVALARKLLVALWRYVDQGILPEGAALKA